MILRGRNRVIRQTGIGVALPIFAILSAWSGCHVRQPNGAEQEELLRRGYFANGTPPWVVAGGAAGQSGVSQRYSVGLMPPKVSGQPRLTETSFTVASEYDQELERRREAVMKEEESTEESKEPVTVSPLVRIEQLCPEIEPLVRETLTTTSLSDRITNWRALTLRCPQSADLWYWLGTDYYRDQKLVAAGRCLERAVTIDNANVEAKNLLEKIRGQQNAPTADVTPEGKTE